MSDFVWPTNPPGYEPPEQCGPKLLLDAVGTSRYVGAQTCGHCRLLVLDAEWDEHCNWHLERATVKIATAVGIGMLSGKPDAELVDWLTEFALANPTFAAMM